MDIVYEVNFQRESIIICSTLDKAKEAVKMLLKDTYFSKCSVDDFDINEVELNRCYYPKFKV